MHELNTKAVQDSHLRLLGQIPAEGEKGWWGRGQEGEWQGGIGGRVESVGLCLKNGGSTEKESEKKVNNTKSNKKGGERAEKKC